MKSAGLISLGGYLPGKEVKKETQKDLADFLRKQTLLYPEYIEPIEKDGRLPGRIETNKEGWEDQPWFEAWLERLPEKKKADPFQGTKERRRVPLDPVSIKKSIHPHPMLASDAETLAGALAIFNAKINPDDIDLVLVSSLVPDRHVPLNASLVQHKLGLKNSGAYNVDTCCSSFVTMCEMAMTYVRAGLKKNVLIVASSLDSIISDRSTYFSPYIADAAMAGIVSEVADGEGYLSSHCTSHGDRHTAIIFKHRQPELFMCPSQGPNREQEFVTFYDQEACKVIARNAQQDMVEVANKSLEKASLKAQDIDFLITHQPVEWAANAWREAIGVAENKYYESFKTNANIACCAVPANFLEAIEKGLIKAGDKVMIASSGVGENHIAVMQKISPQLIENVKL